MAGRMKFACAAALTATLTTACGSSSKSTASTAAPSTSVTRQTTSSGAIPSAATPDAPSTTADPRPLNVADQTLALAGELQAGDFSTAWTQFAPAEARSVDPEACAYRPGGALTFVTNGGGQAGPTLQLGQTGAFTSSFSLAFPDEAAAIDYISVVNTPEWGTCRTRQFQKFQVDNGSDSVVSVATRDEPSLHQNGFESYAQFNVSAADGTVQRYIISSFYRLGRVVINVNQEYAGLSEADFKTYTDDNYAALIAAYGRINKLP
ncbi:MAG: hypothetical protein QOE09_3015 [Ilumatobacteraceae bacterium]